jgi:hypothetical protein
MKTSSKVILENININKELRVNVALIDDKPLSDLFNAINRDIDDLNHEKLNESEKIFLLETLIKRLIEFSNKTFNKLYYENSEKIREKEKVKRLKSFIDYQKDQKTTCLNQVTMMMNFPRYPLH